MQKFLMKQKIKKYAKKYVLKQQAKYQAPLYPAPRTPYPSEDEDTITADTYEDEEDDEEDDEEGEEGDDEQQTMNKENYAPTQRARPHLTRPPAYANPPRGSKLAQILGYR